MNDTKPHYKIGEVCELTATQPYVLRFWESEFPALAPEKNRSGQRVYRKCDIDLIQRIKVLLYEKEYTIAGARKILESQDSEVETDSEASGKDAAAPSRDDGGNGQARTGTGRARPLVAGTSAEAEETSPPLPFRTHASADHQLAAEVKNLRAKLARAEAELKAVLADMDRHDEPAV